MVGTLTGLLPAGPDHWSETLTYEGHRQGTVPDCRINEKKSLVQAAGDVKHLTVRAYRT